MNQMVFDSIVQALTNILMERRALVPELTPQTPLSATGLDSLDIATLTVCLDEKIGRVPEEALRQYPNTLGELTDLYARSQRSQPAPAVLRT